MSQLSRKQQTQKRHRRLRRHITGTSDRPRLAVFRSNNHIYAQVIDDLKGHTLASASSSESGHEGSTGNVDGAKADDATGGARIRVWGVGPMGSLAARAMVRSV